MAIRKYIRIFIGVALFVLTSTISVDSIITDVSSNQQLSVKTSYSEVLFNETGQSRTGSVCIQCNEASSHGGLCNCSGWIDKKSCMKHQMTCKQQCGVCLPDVAKSARTWPKCYDHSDSCTHYRNYHYCVIYPKWMKFMCKYSCGYCDECTNDNNNCNQWKNEGLCEKIPNYMLEHCRKSCQVCDCHDYSMYCKIWADNQQCELNPAAVRKKCPLSCGVCAPRVPIPVFIIPDVKEQLFETTSTTPTTTKTATTTTATTRKTIPTIPTATTVTTTQSTPQNTKATTEPIQSDDKGTAPTTFKSSSKTPNTPTAPMETPESLTTSERTTEFVFPIDLFTAEPTTPPVEPTTTPVDGPEEVYINDKNCGVPSNDTKKRFRRIVGGDELLPPGSWPWIVGITAPSHPNRVDCGGSLLTNQFILTAAHCFSRPGGMEPSQYVIRLGEHDLSRKSGTENFAHIDQIYIHQLYNIKTYDYDIAVARLSSPVKLTRTIRPACIADYNDAVVPGTTCFVAGWGFRDEGVPGPPELKVAKVPIGDYNDCSLKYGLILETVTPRMLCASGDGNADSCEGDSGGPLVCRRSDNNFQQVGIVSWGVGCNRKDLYGVYTNVATQRRWIDGIVEKYSR